MSEAKPTGQLMTGAVGSFMNAGAWLIMLTVGAAIISMVMSAGGGADPGVSVDGARAMGGAMILAFLLLLAGGICGGIGFMGFNKLYPGTGKLGGTFGIVSSAILVLAIVAGVVGIEALGEVIGHGIFISLALFSLLGGLAMLGAKAIGGMAQVAGILMIVGGALMLLVWFLALVNVDLGDFTSVVVYALFAATAAGHLVAGIVMLGQRK